MENKMYRITTAVWLLLAFTVKDVVMQTADTQSQFNVTAIIVATVSATAVVVVVIICVGYIYFTKVVNKIQTKTMMRELIDNRHRIDLIDTPEKLATLNDYFKKYEADVARMVAPYAEIEETNEHQRAEAPTTKRYKIVKVIDMMITTESETKRTVGKLKAPEKVKQMYEERKMSEYERDVDVTFSNIDKNQNETSFDKKTESEQSVSDNYTHANNVSNKIKAHFLNIPEIDQFFSPEFTTEKRKKKRKNRDRRKKSRLDTPKHFKSFTNNSSTDFNRSCVGQQFKIHKRKTKRRSKTEIAKDNYNARRRKLSHVERASVRLRSNSPRQSRNSASETLESLIVQVNEKNKHNVTANDAVPSRLPTATSISSSRTQNVSLASSRSKPSETFVSVSDIGLSI